MFAKTHLKTYRQAKECVLVLGSSTPDCPPNRPDFQRILASRALKEKANIQEAFNRKFFDSLHTHLIVFIEALRIFKICKTLCLIESCVELISNVT
jgi:hypothetical protein